MYWHQQMLDFVNSTQIFQNVKIWTQQTQLNYTFYILICLQFILFTIGFSYAISAADNFFPMTARILEDSYLEPEYLHLPRMVLTGNGAGMLGPRSLVLRSNIFNSRENIDTFSA